MANGNQIKFGVGYEVDKASVQKVKKSLQELQNVKFVNFSGTREELRQIQGVANQVQQALTKAFNVKLNSLNTNTFNKQLQSMGLNVNKIYQSFSKMGVQGQVAFSSMASSILTTNLHLKETSNLVSKMGQTMANTAKWGIASSIMNSFTNSVQQAFQYVKSLDSALTDIRIVTGDSTERMKQFAVQANQAAQALGRSTMDYSKAALTFYQQGLSDQDVQARTQSTLIAQNITGAGQEMADYLTAVWNGYKVANEEAELYVDKLAAVADTSASNMSQLAVAMSKVASTANMLGVPIDSLNAQIATIVATTRQAPESVGNALKTIYARINDISTGADDAQMSLGNYSSKMAEVGISVLDANGRLRDTGDVIDEVGQKWATLSREQQIYLARTMAGQRQYNNLLALFENWGRYTDLVNVSMDAQGAAMEKNERYMDSLAAKMEQFGAAGERVKASLINEEDLKGIVDFGTGAVNLFGSLIDGIGGGRNAILALGSIFTSVFSGTIAKELNSFITNIQNAKINTELLKNDIQNLQTFKAFGENNKAVEKLTSHIGELQKYYSVLDQATINNQKNLIGELDALENNKMQLEANKEAIIEYANKIQGVNTAEIWEKDSEAVLNLNNALGNLQGSSANVRDLFASFLEDNISLERFTQHFNEFYEAYNQLNPEKAQALFNAFNNGIGASSGNFRQLLTQALNQADNKARLYSQTIDNAAQKQQQLNNKTQQLESIISQNEKGFKQLFDVNSIVKFAAGVGQIASSINTIINLTKTWKNENISLGEKITQTFTSIGFMLPMLISAYTNIRTSLGVQSITQQKILQTKNKEIIANEILIKQEERKKLEAQQQLLSAKSLENTRIGISNEGLTKDIENTRNRIFQVDKEIDGLKGTLEETGKSSANMGTQFKKMGSSMLNSIKSAGSAIVGFLAGPGGIIVAIGALAAIVGVSLYKAWNRAKEAAQQATKQMQAANDIYKESKDKLDDLKSSLESLKDAQDNLNQLTTGTEEWRSALEDVNNQVIELLEKFPELAKYVSTSSNGMLQISEEGQQYIIDQQRQTVQANAIGYLSGRQRSDAANRQSEITQASRNWGMGAWDSSVLDKVVTAVQEEGSRVLQNTTELKNLTGANDKQIDAINKHKSEIITLAEKLTANTTATDSLTQSIITGTFIDPDKIASSINSDIFTAQTSKAIANATLDYSKYGIDPNKTYRNASADEWQTAYRKASQSGQSISDFVAASDQIIIDEQAKKKIVERYKEINSDIADQISISGGKIIKTAKDTKEKTQLNFEDVMQAVATADATTSEGMKQIYEHAEQVAQEMIRKFGDDATNIYKLGAGTLAAGQISIEDLLSFRNNEDIIKTLMDQTGKTKNQILQIIADLALQTSKGITEYITSLPEGIKADLKTLSDRDQDNRWDISESVMKSIGESLQKAWENGTYDQYLDLLKNVKPEDMAGVTEFIDSLGEDINSIDTNTFIQKLADLGYELDESAQEKVPELIAALKELNGINLQEGLGQLYDGATSFLEKYAKDANATLTKNEFESLSGIAAGLDMDLNQFFDQTWKGSYKLKTTAQEFFDYINNQSLEGFKDAISDAQVKLGQLTGVQTYQQNTGYNAKDLSFWVGRTGEQGDNARIAAANFLQSLGGQASTNSYLEQIINGSVEDLEGAIEFLQNELPKVADQWDNIGEAINNASNNVDKISSQETEILAEQQEMRQQFREMQLDSDVDVDSWKNLTQYLSDFGGQIPKVSEDVEEFQESAENLAQDILRFSSAIQESTKNLQTWKQQLSSGAASEMAEASAELKNVYQDLLGLDTNSNLSADFTGNIENLQLLEQAIQGVESAYDQLQIRAATDIRMQISPELDFETAYTQAQSDLAYLNQLISQSPLEIKVGTYIDDGPILTGLQSIVNGIASTASTAEQAQSAINAYLDSLGWDANLKLINSQAEQLQEQVEYVPTPQHQPVIGTYWVRDGKSFKKQQLTDYYPYVSYEPRKTYKKAKKQAKGFSFEVQNATKKAGGGVKFSNINHNSPSGGSGGSGGGGGGGTAKQPTIAKPSTAKIETEEKQQFVNPYEQIQRSYDKQEDSLKTLNDLQKKLTGKDRLTNLKQQNKELEKQNKIISKRQDISNDSSKEGTTAYYRNQIQTDKALRNVAKFDDDGTLINQTATKNAAVNAYNQQLNAYKQDFEKTQKDYNNWIENVWNKYSGEEQQAHKQEKEARDQDLKDFESTTKEKIKLADEEYNEKIKLIENYQKALQKDQKFHQQLLQNLEKIIENTIAEKKIKVDLTLDFGQTEREFMDFENKFIKKIKKDDIFANAKASFRELQSYVTSGELNQLASKIKNLQNDIASISNGAFNSRFGIDRTTWDKLTEEQRENLRKGTLNTLKEELEDYSKKYMDSLEKIQDLQEEIREAYLDSIDDAKDKMDDVIDQYERINDLVEHNIKLTQLLYGDNAGFDTLDKYYAKQERNNLNQLKQLRQYQAYWKGQLNNAIFGTEEWKRFKENLENVTDEINSVLENQLELITTKFENQVQKALQNVQNKLTKGLGVDYLDQEWDHITQDDDAFLDAVNTRFGIDEVERLYQDAAAGVAGNIPQQQRINKLMNDQLKLLREKDRLTQYDIDRAKAALEVEKARMELEDSRYNKTKMRLRRDSQGNYTYQYVADEEKLSDLESALADAQANLYNMDKEHYQQQLEEMNSAYRKYLEDYAELTKQYEATQDKAEKARLEARMKQLKERFSNYVDSINEDANFTLRIYLPGSTGDALGVDTSAMTGEQTLEFLKNTVPGVNSAYTELSQTLLEQGGVVQASTQYFKDLANAVKEAAAAQKQVLSAAGTSVSKVASGKDSADINQVEKYLEPYKNVANTAVQTIDQMQKLNDIVDKFCNKNININKVAESLENVYTILQDINTLSDRSITTVFGTDDEELASIIGTTKKDAKAVAKKNDLTSAERSSLQSLFYKSIADAYENENQAMELAQYVNSFYDSGKKMSDKRKAALLKQLQTYQNNIAANVDKAQRINTALNQNVDISATFPNVTDRNEIVEAINILNGKAAQKASKKKA